MAAPTEADAINFNTQLDMDIVPLQALGPKTRLRLSTYLNNKKILLSENFFPRDWRGLFDLARIPKPYFQAIESSSNPMQELMVRWQEDGEGATLGRLQKFLIDIDRVDCMDDCKELFDDDAKDYYSLMKKPKMENVIEPKGCMQSLLTVDDSRGAAIGLPLQQYDAFMIYAEDDEEDTEFAGLMIKELTENRDLKICSVDSMLGGSTFEHDAKRTLLTKRCNRLIVILSNAFNLNNQDTFLANLAQSIGIENQMRKLIPCVYKKCDVIPEMFKHMTILNYERSKKLNNFWDRLYESVKSVPTPSNKTYESAIKLNDQRDVRVTTMKPSQISKSTTALQYPSPPSHQHTETMLSLRPIYPPALQRRNSVSMAELQSSELTNITQSLALTPSVEEEQKKKSKIKALLDKFTKKDKKKKVAVAAGC